MILILGLVILITVIGSLVSWIWLVVKGFQNGCLPGILFFFFPAAFGLLLGAPFQHIGITIFGLVILAITIRQMVAAWHDVKSPVLIYLVCSVINTVGSLFLLSEAMKTPDVRDQVLPQLLTTYEAAKTSPAFGKKEESAFQFLFWLIGAEEAAESGVVFKPENLTESPADRKAKLDKLYRELGGWYQQLQKDKAALNPNDSAAVTAYNEEAALYQQLLKTAQAEQAELEPKAAPTPTPAPDPPTPPVETP